MENKKEEIKKITLKLTEFELFKLEQLLKIGADGLENLELNTQGMTDSAIKAIDNNMKFMAKVLTQLIGGIDEQTRYDTYKMFFTIKMANKIKMGGF